MRTFLAPFFALALFAVLAGCKHESDSGSMGSMSGDKVMSPPATMPADAK
jgi:hypothetical protein